MTKREAALQALEACLMTVAGATVKRNDPLPTAAPPGGLIILRDGEPGEPGVTLSPATWSWQHQAEVEVIVQKALKTARIAGLDDLLSSIGAALAADRTLGGAVDTPFHHQGRLKGVGVDCLGLVVGVGRALGLSSSTPVRYSCRVLWLEGLQTSRKLPPAARMASHMGWRA